MVVLEAAKAASKKFAEAAVDPRYPITKQLAKAFPPSSKNAIRRIRPRESEPVYVPTFTEVVSEQLCDDVIGYLAPTLEQHRGCTIIDANPGACLWSAKIHDFLKPKRHVLMEPDERYFDPFIKPLLETPGSTYRHVPLTGAHRMKFFNNYRIILNDPDLVARPDLPVDDPRCGQFDPSLLLIGNLARDYHREKNPNSPTTTSRVLQNMTWAAVAHELFHNRGLVRMLWWIPEYERYALFPMTELRRNAVNASWSITCEMNRVAGCDYGTPTFSANTRGRPRPDIMEAYTAKRVRDSMQALLISPLDARFETMDHLQAEIEATRERFTLVKKYSTMMPKTGAKSVPRKQLEDKLIDSLAFPQMLYADKREGVTFGVLTKTLGFRSICLRADLGLRVVRLEVGLKVLEEHGTAVPELDRLRAQLLELGEQVEKTFEKTERNKMLITQLINEQIAMFVDPPVLARDARKYEPLNAKVEEFWPQSELMLVDVMPTTRDLSVPDLAEAKEGAIVCRGLLANLIQASSQSLPDMLDRIAPNAAKDLIPQIPAATDPRKGGRLNPKNVPTRMLSPDIMEQLTKAFIEWPFKPSNVSLELAAESAASGEEENSESTEAVPGAA
ncbi:hypothetical protein BAUCODRAFT_368216 [Baudoinia panamericana UAMH 10762]|uniref:rRNA adenine N(6)-methyltransferase n=1 Tax=Baudoinia panamericana (strain UAMH 10762) TaxID=717646 RepID=M2MTH8_BAUPA|nr:uncharacterized protein BAUCODRAFT_368216 [Baudoinia panamericana UAMH 10762]EMD00212.1 hypothetical protein BAUCODRAFT_368216 [Baudoinia panamericana UAMH 10762]